MLLLYITQSTQCLLDGYVSRSRSRHECVAIPSLFILVRSPCCHDKRICGRVPVFTNSCPKSLPFKRMMMMTTTTIRPNYQWPARPGLWLQRTKSKPYSRCTRYTRGHGISTAQFAVILAGHRHTPHGVMCWIWGPLTCCAIRNVGLLATQ
jgi:hypothetical protein